MTEEICEVIITAADPSWLVEFTKKLISERLCACGQNVAPIRSLYQWDGAIQDDQEARVALHTRLSLVEQIIARTNLEHPYDVPCVIAVPIAAANPAYAKWVVAETMEPQADGKRT